MDTLDLETPTAACQRYNRAERRFRAAETDLAAAIVPWVVERVLATYPEAHAIEVEGCLGESENHLRLTRILDGEDNALDGEEELTATFETVVLDVEPELDLLLQLTGDDYLGETKIIRFDQVPTTDRPALDDPREAAVTAAAEAIFKEITGGLTHDGSECDEAVWQDALHYARLALDAASPVPPPRRVKILLDVENLPQIQAFGLNGWHAAGVFSSTLGKLLELLGGETASRVLDILDAYQDAKAGAGAPELVKELRELAWWRQEFARRVTPDSDHPKPGTPLKGYVFRLIAIPTSAETTYV